MGALRKSHQDMGKGEAEHGPDDHGLSPDPVAQNAPEGLHAGRDQEGGGKDDTAPDLERLIPIDAEVPQVKRQEGNHHVEADAGNELGRPDAVKIFFPEFHSNGCAHSCSCESIKAADVISNMKMKKEIRPCFFPERRKTGLLIEPPLWISDKIGSLSSAVGSCPINLLHLPLFT